MPHIELPVHSADTVPEASHAALDAARRTFGFVPNLVAMMAESPALVHAHMDVHKELSDHSSLTPQELQIVFLAVSHTNSCPYCVAAHSTVGQLVGLEAAHIAASRDGARLADTRLEALRVFTAAMVHHRGHVTDDTVKAFVDAGFDGRAILDIIAAIAYKTMSNYTDHLAQAPLDAPFKKWTWTREAASTTTA